MIYDNKFFIYIKMFLVDYILFEEKKKGEYNHMGIAKDAVSGSRYVETFFHESSDKYIAGQKTVKVKSYKVYDINGNVLF